MRGEIEKLIESFQNLSYIGEKDGRTIVTGNVLVHKVYNDFPVYKEFHVKIEIPQNFRERIPEIWEIGNQIENSYQHRYSDGKLCLAADAEMKIDFLKGLSLTEWVEKYIIAYFYSYEYYKRYNEYPFGERSHGCLGILEFYSSYFGIDDVAKTYKFMEKLRTLKYRGHDKCPCGSEKKARNCHGSIIIDFFRTGAINIVSQDFLAINSEVKEMVRGERGK